MIQDFVRTDYTLQICQCAVECYIQPWLELETYGGISYADYQ